MYYVGLLRLHEKFWHGYNCQLQWHLPPESQLSQRVWRNQYPHLYYQQMQQWHLLVTSRFWDGESVLCHNNHLCGSNLIKWNFSSQLLLQRILRRRRDTLARIQWQLLQVLDKVFQLCVVIWQDNTVSIMELSGIYHDPLPQILLLNINYYPFPVYVDVGAGSSDTATLALAFSGSNTNRKWDIKVAQIPCGTRYAPDSGCLQWQVGLTGQITTFNFPDTDGPHLPSQE